MLTKFDHFSRKYIAFKTAHIVARRVVVAYAKYFVARRHRKSAAYLCRLYEHLEKIEEKNKREKKENKNSRLIICNH
jgi:hypothetical protein